MTRTTSAVSSRARRKKILKRASGYQNRHKNCFRIAKQKVEKALQYAYRDRRTRKRKFRQLWIQRLNAAARLYGCSYAQFMNGIHKAGIMLDRKVLSDIAIKEPIAFKKIVEQIKPYMLRDASLSS